MAKERENRAWCSAHFILRDTDVYFGAKAPKKGDAPTAQEIQKRRDAQDDVFKKLADAAGTPLLRITVLTSLEE